MNENVYTKDRYYEAILQLRPNNPLLVLFVKDQLARRKNVFISKEISTKYGTDLYLTDKKFARDIARKLKQNFNGTIKTSAALYSRDRLTSKLVYRLTVCFRLK